MSPQSLAPTTGYDTMRERVAMPQKLEHLALVLRRLHQAEPDLPPVISMWTDGHVLAIQPWVSGAPITALLAYGRHLDDPVRHAVPLRNPDGSPTEVTNISMTGVIEGLRVAIYGSTYRTVEVTDAEDGAVDEGVFERLAALEQPITDDEIVAMLADWDVAEAAAARVAADTA